MAFELHPALLAKLHSGWDMKFNHQSFLQNMRRLWATDEVAVFQAVLWPTKNAWAWVRARVESGSPKVHFWAQVGYGSRDHFAPRFDREFIAACAGDRHQMIESPTPEVPTILHGQGVTMKSLRIDFETADADLLAPRPLEPTDYVPRDATQTGGKWGYMGLTHPIAKHDLVYWQKQLYALGNYGGQYMHKHGSLVTEKDVPNAVGGFYFHERAYDKGWIAYSDPRNPWRDSSAAGWVGADYEHLSIYDALCQAYLAHPKDEGFAMLIVVGAERVLMELPGRAKGTTHHLAQQHRAQGRTLKTLVWLHRALDRMGYVELRDRIAHRAVEVLQWQLVAWRKNMRDRGKPWMHFGRGGLRAYNPSEIGIHFWGLKALDDYLEVLGVEHAGLQMMLRETARFCFDAYRDYGDGGWNVPWFINLDGTLPPDDDGSSPHFAWLAAVNHKPQSAEEQQKLQAIQKVGDRLDPRWKE